MPIAGWCGQCGQYMWLAPTGGCIAGHDASVMSNHYDTETGQAVAPQPAPAPAPVAAPAPQPAPVAAPAPQPAPVAAPAPAAGGERGTRLGLLADMLAMFAQYPDYTAKYGTDTDITIDNLVAQASWATGKKKVEYSAIMKAVEAERTLYFWEILKESGGGLNFGGFNAETTSTFGAKRWGSTKEVIVGPGGVVANYSWDYAQTRRIVESVAAGHGWKVKVVINPKSAKY